MSKTIRELNLGMQEVLNKGKEKDRPIVKRDEIASVADDIKKKKKDLEDSLDYK